MVGVGGRSKACDQCRRRRVKCDRTIPGCQRCVKAGLSCGGYRGLSILQYDGQSGRAVLSDGSASSPLTASSISKDGLAVIRAGSSSSVSRVRPWNLQGLTIPEEELFISYTQSRFLWDAESMATLTGINRTLTEQCLIALATTFFGIEHMEHGILRRGLHQYGKSLKTLNNMLGDSVMSQTQDVLEAIIIMSLFEFLVGDCADGWLNHSRGLEKLLNLRGPESMRSLPSLMILEKSRTNLVFSAIVMRQRTILAAEEWKTIPWADYPERKDAIQRLGDILADCPELFVLREGFYDIVDMSRRRRVAKFLLAKARSILNRLQIWRRASLEILNSRIEVPSPPGAPKITNLQGKPTLVWETVFQFPSLQEANAFTFYQSTLILVLRFHLEIQRSLNEDEGSQRALMQAAGIAICRSVDYHIESIRNRAGSFFILFPVRMAYEAVGTNDQEIGQWLKDVLQRISSGVSGRWATARYLLDIRAAKSRPSPPDTPLPSTPS